MTFWRVFIKEILHRKANFALSIFAVIIAVGSFLGAIMLLEVHDINTQSILAEKQAQTQKKMKALQEEMRQATLKLSFNLLILPKGQNLRDWYTQGYATKYMPEEYVTRLADSGIIIVRHFLPVLQQKIKWPETKRTIILIGTRGEVPNLHKNPTKPLVQPVPAGTIVLGHELHQGLNLKAGDKVELMGKKFTIHQCHEERGSKDDITAWIYLPEAQELLDKQGLISAILALECLCEGPESLLPKIRGQIAQILPGTIVIEKGTKALARAEARSKVGREAKAAIEREKQNRSNLKNQRQQFAATIVPVILIACAVWIGYLSFSNVRDRKSEIGILRAMGFSHRPVLSLFLMKSLLTGLAGGILGILISGVLGSWLINPLSENVEMMSIFNLISWSLMSAALIMAAGLSVIAGWIPAMLASQQDPVDVLTSS